METTKQKVGKRVRELRKARGFRSAEDLAAALDMHATSVYELERGDNWISPEMLEKLATTLKAPPSAFFEAGAPASTETRESILGKIVLILAHLDKTQLSGVLGQLEHLADLAPDSESAVGKSR